MANLIHGGRAHRIRQGEFLLATFTSLTTPSPAQAVLGQAELQYDDGTFDWMLFPDKNITVGGLSILTNNAAPRDGWITGVWIWTAKATANGSIYARVFVVTNQDLSSASIGACIARGYVTNFDGLLLDQQEPMEYRATYVFQGQVVSDATAGTHVCTLTVQPGLGNTLELIAGQGILAGAAALAASTIIDDGVGDTILTLSSAAAAGTMSFPIAAASQASGNPAPSPPIRISGTMRLIVTLTTSTVSQTQVFSLLCRLRGSLPTATLADSVGTPTLTTNANKVF